jgi:peptide/nickel transport system ATP-binding protein
MYRGEIVERGPSDDVILRPSHPYTQILASAAPDPTLPRAALAQARRDRQAARSARQPRSAREPSAPGQTRGDDTGCRFRARCPSAMPACAQHPPEFTAAPVAPDPGAAGHLARCWLLDPSVVAAPRDGV